SPLRQPLISLAASPTPLPRTQRLSQLPRNPNPSLVRPAFTLKTFTLRKEQVHVKYHVPSQAPFLSFVRSAHFGDPLPVLARRPKTPRPFCLYFLRTAISPPPRIRKSI